MATSYGNPPVITEGLRLYYDAGNALSYPGSGSSWFDVAGNKLNATLFNSPVPNSSGYINFVDSSQQYATGPNLGNLTTWTAEVWFRLSASLTNKVSAIICNQYDLSSKLNFSVGTNNAPISYNLVVGFFDGAWHNTTGFVPSTNTWYQVVGTYNGSTISQYVNGVANGGTLSYSGTPQSGGETRMMRRWDYITAQDNLVAGDLSIARVYNRALTDTEILQNFNSNRSRFKL